MKNLVSTKTGSFLLIFFLILSVALIPGESFSKGGKDSIHVNDFTIIGNDTIRTEKILAFIESHRDREYLDKDYTFAELKKVADWITEFYKFEGYVLAEAYVPKQELKGGIVTIVVVEGPAERFSEEPKDSIHVNDFAVNDFAIVGNKAMDTEEILDFLEDYRDKDYTLPELKEVAGRITELYHQEGYILAKAYIPKQEVVNGLVTIVIAEGELGFIEVTDNKYYTSGFVRNWFSHLKREAVREQNVERAILLINDTPALNVTTAFRRGKKPGTADIIVKVKDSYPLSLDFEYNNHGNPRVSRDRIGFNLHTLLNPFSGSELNLKGLMGEKFDNTFYGHIDFQSPIGYQGARWGLRYLYADYLVGGDLEVLGIEGESQILGGYVKYPFIRSKKHNLYTTVGFDYKHMFEYVLDTQKSNDDLSIAYLRLDYDSIDRFFGDEFVAKNYASFNYSHGFDSVFGSIKQDDPDSSNPFADGRFDKFNLDAVRVQRLWKDIILLLKGSGQLSTARLTNGEMFSIGGANSVRGERLSEYLGEHGYLASLEISSSYPFIWLKNLLFLDKRGITDDDVKKTIRAVAFGDHGGVFRSDPIIGEHKDEFLLSIGLGARLYLFERVDLKFDIGFPFRTGDFEFSNEIIYLMVNYNAVKF